MKNFKYLYYQRRFLNLFIFFFRRKYFLNKNNLLKKYFFNKYFYLEKNKFINDNLFIFNKKKQQFMKILFFYINTYLEHQK